MTHKNLRFILWLTDSPGLYNARPERKQRIGETGKQLNFPAERRIFKNLDKLMRGCLAVVGDLGRTGNTMIGA